VKKLYQNDEDNIVPFQLEKAGDSKKDLIEIKKEMTEKLVLKDTNHNKDHNKTKKK